MFIMIYKCIRTIYQTISVILVQDQGLHATSLLYFQQKFFFLLTLDGISDKLFNCNDIPISVPYDSGQGWCNWTQPKQTQKTR